MSQMNELAKRVNTGWIFYFSFKDRSAEQLLQILSGISLALKCLLTEHGVETFSTHPNLIFGPFTVAKPCWYVRFFSRLRTLKVGVYQRSASCKSFRCCSSVWLVSCSSRFWWSRIITGTACSSLFPIKALNGLAALAFEHPFRMVRIGRKEATNRSYGSVEVNWGLRTVKALHATLVITLFTGYFRVSH